jgi:hypothetical protein
MAREPCTSEPVMAGGSGFSTWDGSTVDVDVGSSMETVSETRSHSWTG